MCLLCLNFKRAGFIFVLGLSDLCSPGFEKGPLEGGHHVFLQKLSRKLLTLSVLSRRSPGLSGPQGHCLGSLLPFQVQRTSKVGGY